jgi:hypothetical protein
MNNITISNFSKKMAMGALATSLLSVAVGCAVDQKTGVAAALGAAAGCAIGEAKSDKCAKGALIGAAVGAAVQLISQMIIESRAVQVKDDAQISKTYLNDHPALPKEPALVQYRRFTLPEKTVSAGMPVKVTSDIEVVPGAGNRVAQLAEEISIYDVDQKTLLKSLKKDINNQAGTAGAYQNEFSFTLPKGMPEGVYPIKTELFLNGASADKTVSTLQIVAGGQDVSMR